MANHGHKRDTNARSKPKAALVAGPLAALATVAVVAVGVLSGDPTPRQVVAAQETSSSISDEAVEHRVDLRERGELVSRSDSRRVDGVTFERAFDVNLSRSATREAVQKADTRLWTTAALNLWTTPGKDAAEVGLVEAGKRILVTGRDAAGRDEVVIDGRARWVTSGYLAAEKPVEEVAVEESTESQAAAAPAAAECTNGTSVPSGVSPNIVAVHEAVCAAFPEITTYGTFRDDGEHAQGLAVDIMVSGARGWEVAEYVRSHYAELGVNYLIYSQQIWSVDRGGEGWRGMEDRGSSTANHYDHVHVTTY